MTEDFEPDVLRFLELLRVKISWNILTRFKVYDDSNPSLKIVRYQTAPGPHERGLDLFAEIPPPVSGEMKVNADLIGRIFRFALAHEDSLIPFWGSRMVFYDVVDYKHERYQSFVLLFLSTDIL
jgi:hypothetical protein